MSDQVDDHTHDVPRPVAVLTWFPGVELAGIRAIPRTFADELAVVYVARRLDLAFQADLELEIITASITGFGTWSSPVPGVVEPLALVFGHHFLPREGYHPRGRGAAVALDVAAAFVAVKLDEIGDDETEPGPQPEGLRVVY